MILGALPIIPTTFFISRKSMRFTLTVFLIMLAFCEPYLGRVGCGLCVASYRADVLPRVGFLQLRWTASLCGKSRFQVHRVDALVARHCSCIRTLSYFPARHAIHCSRARGGILGRGKGARTGEGRQRAARERRGTTRASRHNRTILLFGLGNMLSLVCCGARASSQTTRRGCSSGLHLVGCPLGSYSVCGQEILLCPVHVMDTCEWGPQCRPC